MKVNKSNYESLALEYLEGTLSAEQRRAFEAFLTEDEQAAGEIRLLQEEVPHLADESVIYPHKAALHRGVQRPWMRPFLSLAATAAVLLIGLLLVQQRGQQDAIAPEQLARQEPVAAKDSLASAPEAVMSTETVQLAVADPIVEPSRQPKVLTTKKIELKKEVVSALVQRQDTVQRFAVPASVLSGAKSAYPARAEVEPLQDDKMVIALSAMKPDSADIEAIMVAQDEQSRRKIREGVRRGFAAMILAPLDNLTPIRTFKTETKSGVQIASIRFTREPMSQDDSQ